jgi:hypothetical protein
VPRVPPRSALLSVLQNDDLAMSYFTECINTIDIGLGTERAEQFARAFLGQTDGTEIRNVMYEVSLVIRQLLKHQQKSMSEAVRSAGTEPPSNDEQSEQSRYFNSTRACSTEEVVQRQDAATSQRCALRKLLSSCSERFGT